MSSIEIKRFGKLRKLESELHDVMDELVKKAFCIYDTWEVIPCWKFSDNITDVAYLGQELANTWASKSYREKYEAIKSNDESISDYTDGDVYMFKKEDLGTIAKYGYIPYTPEDLSGLPSLIGIFVNQAYEISGQGWLSPMPRYFHRESCNNPQCLDKCGESIELIYEMSHFD